MNKIPSADEFLNSEQFEPDQGISFEDYHGDSISGITTTAMVEFARLHVEAALKAASEQQQLLKIEEGNEWVSQYFEYFSVDRDKILTAYPLTNII